MKKRTFLHSLNDAVKGFIHVVKHERNMRVHFLTAFFVLLLAAFLGVRRLEWMILSVTVCFVLVTEMINTAIEDTMDLVKGTFHPAVRVIKDISAGMVLVSVLNALIVGFFIFSRYWAWPMEFTTLRLRYASIRVMFITLLVVVFLVIAGKAFRKRGLPGRPAGTPFRGGAVSGHAAVAFSLWTMIALVQSNFFITTATFCLAILVAQSRLRARIHSFWEAVAGAAIGISVTAFLFKLFIF
ncbi:MAG: diacylglycerol kinase [Candidatus Omnitrophica bacterium]|nr:diacylglycerol kinase [Candidatus Omnitrophota bacterium]